MQLNPNKWADNLFEWTASRAKFVADNSSQILQIFATLVILIACAGGIQYIPFLIKWQHVSDLAFGKMVVYSLPLWVTLAFYLIWRSDN